jgi:hypothetical protein
VESFHFLEMDRGRAFPNSIPGNGESGITFPNSALWIVSELFSGNGENGRTFPNSAQVQEIVRVS